MTLPAKVPMHLLQASVFDVSLLLDSDGLAVIVRREAVLPAARQRPGELQVLFQARLHHGRKNLARGSRRTAKGSTVVA